MKKVGVHIVREPVPRPSPDGEKSFRNHVTLGWNHLGLSEVLSEKWDVGSSWRK